MANATIGRPALSPRSEKAMFTEMIEQARHELDEYLDNERAHFIRIQMNAE